MPDDPIQQTPPPAAAAQPAAPPQAAPPAADDDDGFFIAPTTPQDNAVETMRRQSQPAAPYTPPPPPQQQPAPRQPSRLEQVLAQKRAADDATSTPQNQPAQDPRQAQQPAQQQQQPAQQPRIPAELIRIAEGLGISRQAAESFSSPQSLAQALATFVEQAQQNATVQQQQASQQQQQQPPAPELPDPAELERLGYDPHIVNMARHMHATNAALQQRVAYYDQLLPQLMNDLQQRNQQRAVQDLSESLTALGHDASLAVDPNIQSRIVRRVVNLQRAYQEEGERPPPLSVLLRQVIPLVVQPGQQGQPPPTPMGNQPPSPIGAPPQQQPSQASLAAAQQASIRAQQMQRRPDGTFLGLPSHRRSAPNANGSALRNTMVDKGLDPGVDPATKDIDISEVFLAG